MGSRSREDDVLLSSLNPSGQLFLALSTHFRVKLMVRRGIYHARLAFPCLFFNSVFAHAELAPA
jgi:hypothetical protein